jgi:class 3 adenylate cyclase/pimeloyl-ACP methyl ester carboxylesterase
MEPRIQYAKTADGVSIAYSVLGEGRALVMITGWPFSHLEAEWRVPTYRLMHERLAEKARLVRYDSRGSGLSQRDVDDLSLDARLLDLDAVADHLALDTLDLLGYGSAGRVAITYAVRHPDRVAHLILWDSFARPSDYYQIPQLQGLLALMNSDWEMFTETVAHVFFGWSAGEPARKFAAFLRDCTTPELGRAALAATSASDVSSLLPQVSTPTMVVRSRDSVFPGIEITRSLASAIPNASLTTVDGVWMTSNELAEAYVRTIHQFLGEGEEAATVTQQPEPSAFRTILFTDIEGSTAMTQRLGDAKARELLREHERITRDCLRTHGGAEVKTMGDGFMASFPSATKALECAVAIQRAFAQRSASLPAHPEPAEGRVEGRAEPQPSAHASTGSRPGESPLATARADRGVSASSAGEAIRVRIGLNAGEPIAEDDPDGRGDLFGTAVIRAARIAAMAQGGEILVANVVRELAEGKGFLFGDRGEVALRGFDDPVRVFEVRWTP